MVSRLTRNEKIAGSTPALGISGRFFFCIIVVFVYILFSFDVWGWYCFAALVVGGVEPVERCEMRGCWATGIVCTTIEQAVICSTVLSRL